MRIYLVCILLALSACATTPQSDKSTTSIQSVDSGNSIIEIAAAESGKYNWQGKTWSVAELQSALVAEDKKNPISEIRLLQGAKSPSIMHTIEVGSLAEAVGAKAFYQRDGEFKSIIMVK